jgi:SlyX protein
VDEQKLMDLESRIAHQDHTIAELNDVVTAQQAQIVALESRVDALRDRLRALSEVTPVAGTGDEPPPHY